MQITCLQNECRYYQPGPPGGSTDYVNQLPMRYSWSRIKLSKSLKFRIPLDSF